MDPKVRYCYEARARVLKALAHPSRLFMIDQLREHERCVCELQQLVGADLSTVSKHLTILRSAGLVLDEKRGAKVFYRLRIPCLTGFLDCMAAVMKSTAETQLESLEMP
ncbi:MAG: winged helix-turn-helix transcriptional regulator [Bryobacterales bacterium]|nr:winged helix-turn-helix transcriptional regulator [Bryobacterales bacterium]